VTAGWRHRLSGLQLGCSGGGLVQLEPCERFKVRTQAASTDNGLAHSLILLLLFFLRIVFTTPNEKEEEHRRRWCVDRAAIKLFWATRFHTLERILCCSLAPVLDQVCTGGKVYIHLHAVVQEANLQHIAQVSQSPGLWRACTRTQERVRTHAKHINLRSLSLAVLD